MRWCPTRPLLTVFLAFVPALSGCADDQALALTELPEPSYANIITGPGWTHQPPAGVRRASGSCPREAPRRAKE